MKKKSEDKILEIKYDIKKIKNTSEKVIQELIELLKIKSTNKNRIIDIFEIEKLHIDTILNKYGNTALILAAYKGHIEIVEYLVTNNANKEAVDRDGNTALIAATYKGHKRVVEYLVASGAKKEAANSNGHTALIIAASSGQREILEYLIEQGASMHFTSTTGWTPLMFAAKNNHTDCLQLLLKYNPDKEAKNNNGETALIIAAEQESVECIKVLLSKGAKKNARANTSCTALMYAAGLGNIKCLKELLSQGADIEAEEKNGYTSLIISAASGKIECLKELQSKNANKNKKTKDESTALIMAAKNGHIGIVEYLVANGAKIEAKNNYGNTALIEAAANGHIEIVEYLVNQGANIEATDSDGNTALILAACKGHVGIVEYLVTNGANKEAVDRDGNTTLILAVCQGYIDIVKYLVSKGANKEAADRNGNTALITATAKGHMKVVKYLVDQRAAIEAKNSNEITALIAAACQGYIDIVKYLVANGADKETANSNGHTALALAAYKGNKEVVEYLVANGADKEAADRDGNTPLILAAKEVHSKIIDYLVAQGADTKLFNNKGDTVLHMFVKNNNYSICKALLSHPNLDPNMQDKKGNTALVVACKKEHLSIVTILLKDKRVLDSLDSQIINTLLRFSHKTVISFLKLILDKKPLFIFSILNNKTLNKRAIQVLLEHCTNIPFFKSNPDEKEKVVSCLRSNNICDGVPEYFKSPIEKHCKLSPNKDNVLNLEQFQINSFSELGSYLIKKVPLISYRVLEFFNKDINFQLQKDLIEYISKWVKLYEKNANIIFSNEQLNTTALDLNSKFAKILFQLQQENIKWDKVLDPHLKFLDLEESQQNLGESKDVSIIKPLIDDLCRTFYTIVYGINKDDLLKCINKYYEELKKKAKNSSNNIILKVKQSLIRQTVDYLAKNYINELRSLINEKEKSDLRSKAKIDKPLSNKNITSQPVINAITDTLLNKSPSVFSFDLKDATPPTPYCKIKIENTKYNDANLALENLVYTFRETIPKAFQINSSIEQLLTLFPIINPTKSVSISDLIGKDTFDCLSQCYYGITRKKVSNTCIKNFITAIYMLNKNKEDTVIGCTKWAIPRIEEISVINNDASELQEQKTATNIDIPPSYNAQNQSISEPQEDSIFSSITSEPQEPRSFSNLVSKQQDDTSFSNLSSSSQASEEGGKSLLSLSDNHIFTNLYSSRQSKEATLIKHMLKKIESIIKGINDNSHPVEPEKKLQGQDKLFFSFNKILEDIRMQIQSFHKLTPETANEGLKFNCEAENEFTKDCALIVKRYPDLNFYISIYEDIIIIINELKKLLTNQARVNSTPLNPYTDMDESSKQKKTALGLHSITSLQLFNPAGNPLWITLKLEIENLKKSKADECISLANFLVAIYKEVRLLRNNKDVVESAYQQANTLLYFLSLNECLDSDIGADKIIENAIRSYNLYKLSPSAIQSQDTQKRIETNIEILTSILTANIKPNNYEEVEDRIFFILFALYDCIKNYDQEYLENIKASIDPLRLLRNDFCHNKGAFNDSIKIWATTLNNHIYKSLFNLKAVEYLNELFTLYLTKHALNP